MIAGDGRFGDGTPASIELQEFLGRVPTESLRQYAEYCLSKAFDESGFFLQDPVNEAGRRLGVQVENGLYRGHKKAVGFDGMWRSPGEEDVIVEVKTTSSYTIDLNKLWSHKTQLLEEGDLSKSPSFLFFVGRDDMV